MAKTNTAEIGFEKEIWKAADKMRGNIEASEYKIGNLGVYLRILSIEIYGVNLAGVFYIFE